MHLSNVAAGVVSFLVYSTPLNSPAIEELQKDDCTQFAQLQSAATLGDGKAQYTLSHWYAEGQCVARDDDAVGKWLAASAKGGYLPAQSATAVLMFSSRHYGEAALMARPAAEKDDPPAEGVLAALYDRGLGGIATNYEAAAMWAKRSAEQGCTFGQLILAGLYAQGRGVPKDSVEADKYYLLSMKGFPHLHAEKMRSLLESTMSTNDVADAVKRADDWKASEK